MENHAACKRWACSLRHDTAPNSAAIAASSEEFRRTPSSRPADKFRSLGAFAHYSESGGLEAIEFARVQEILIADLNLTTTPVEQLLRDVLLLDPDAEIETNSSGFISRLLGADVWTEGDIFQPPQSVIVFANGYYD